MKTKLLFQLLLFGFVTITNAQITINESAYKTNTKVENDTTSKKYSLNLENVFLNKDINLKNMLSTKLNDLKITVNDSSNVILTKKQAEKVSTISDMVKKEIMIDENSVKKNIFYYDYFENKLNTTKTEYMALLGSKKLLNNDFDKLIELENKTNQKKGELLKYKKILKVQDSIKYTQSKIDKWMPSAEESKRDDFFEKIYSKDPDNNNYLLSNLSLQIGTNTASISSELIASYFKMVRVSFGTLMTNSDSSTETPSATSKVDDVPEVDQTNAFQRLLTSGAGNLFLNVELPIYYLQSSTSTFYFNSIAKGGITLKQFSSDVDTSSGNGNIGFNFYGSISSDDKKSFLFFINSNFGGYGGGNDFYSTLNLKSNKIFAFGQATFGLDIARAVRISYMIGTVGSEESIRSKRGVIGIQLLKDLFKN